MIKQILAFSAGLGLGIGGTYLYLNRKYYQRYVKYKAELDEYNESKAIAEEPAETKSTEEDLKDYSEVIEENHYAEFTAKKISKTDIGPEIFWEHPDDWNEPVTYTMYSDGYIVGYAGEVLTAEQIEDYIGQENLAKMGKYEPDVLYVRNYDLKTDYEILKDEDPYSSVYPD